MSAHTAHGFNPKHAGIAFVGGLSAHWLAELIKWTVDKIQTVSGLHLPSWLWS